MKDMKSAKLSLQHKQHQNGHLSPFKFAKLLDPEASWDKDQLGDVLHWIRQIVALVCGLLWGAIPLVGGIWLVVLLKMGALDANKVIIEEQRWRIFTCMWLHAGVFHIFTNMLSLLSVGIRLEQEFGFAKIGFLYIVSGIGGSLLSSLFLRKSISVGASGALFGLLGAMLSELLTNWATYANKLAALTMLVLMILMNLLVGILPHVDNFAHIGGFITGFFLGFILLARPQLDWIVPPGYYGHPMKPQYKLYQHILIVISVIALFAIFTTGFVFLFRKIDGNDYCSWCHYLSCVPTPLWSCDPQCNSIRSGNQLNLTCLNNGNSKLYMLPDGGDVDTTQKLCSLLCI